MPVGGWVVKWRRICLPSGTAMVNSDLDRVIETILKSRAPVRSPGPTPVKYARPTRLSESDGGQAALSWS